MNTNDLLNLHEELFQFLMEYKASKPNFTFAIRVNDDSNGRFRSGMWFHGNDNYIFIGLTDRGDSLNKTPSIGFGIRFKKEELSGIYVEVVCKGAENKPYESVYQDLVDQIEPGATVLSGKYEKELPFAGNLMETIRAFLDFNWDRIYAFFLQQAPDSKFYITEESFNKMLKKRETIISSWESSPLAAEPTANYWWLNANPNIWSIDSLAEGELQTYTSHNEKGNKRRIYKYFQEIKAGDRIIGYESTPVKKIKAVFIATKALHTVAGKEQIEFRIIRKFSSLISWFELQQLTALSECEVLNNNQGSLFKLQSEEFDAIIDLADERESEIEKTADRAYPAYAYKNDPDKPFIPEKEFNAVCDTLLYKQNIIIQGPPGVGKTFIAKKIAYQIMGKRDSSRIEFVQFHQSYSYEEFVQGIRPTSKGEFIVKPGLLYTFALKAREDPDNKYFLIIDEINRGNISKIFGELLMLLERDKRSPDFSVSLAYGEGERFYLPDNLYCIGTMNTADRSLAIIDYALRRRFAFITIKPVYGDAFKAFLAATINATLLDSIIGKMTALNKMIADDPNLQSGFEIGHSYFCSPRQEADEGTWWERIKRHEILPQLEEIWFDNPDSLGKAKTILNG